MDEKQFREKIVKLFTVALVLIILIIGFDKISQLATYLFDVTAPFLVGGLIAVLFNIPVKFLEKHIFKFKGKFTKKLNRGLSLLLSFVFVLSLIGIVIALIVPEISTTYKEITETLPPFVNDVTTYIQGKVELKGELADNIMELKNSSTSWESLVSYVSGLIKNEDKGIVFSVIDVAKNIFSSVGTIVVGFIFGIYALIHKEKIQIFSRKCFAVFIKEEKLKECERVAKLVHSNFVDFFFGQCLECFVVALIFTIIASIFKFKCSILIGILMFFFAFIPYIGNFISCGLGVLFTFALETPERALLFCVLFIIVQTLDGYFLYPKVVGLKVKMPPILIFSSAIIGNGLFGFVGMIIMIPIITTIYMLLKERIKITEKERGKLKEDLINNLEEDVIKNKLENESENVLKNKIEENTIS